MEEVISASANKRAKRVAGKAIQRLWAKTSGSPQKARVNVSVMEMAKEFGVEPTIVAVATAMKIRGLTQLDPPKNYPRSPTRRASMPPPAQMDVWTKEAALQFYASWDWKKLRYAVLTKHGAKCMLCGWSKANGGENHIVVDHIRPLRKFPKLALDPKNLQVLCNDCNMGKSDKAFDDFR